MILCPAARIFLAGKNEFYLAEDMVTDVEKHMVDDDLTIEKICNFLQDKKPKAEIFPLFCPKCKRESLINAVNLQVTLCADKIG